MGLIIYGTKKKLKIDKTLGAVTCPNCGHYVEMSLAREKGYFHIDYIPLIPLSPLRIKACPVCGISEVLSKEDYSILNNGFAQK